MTEEPDPPADDKKPPRKGFLLRLPPELHQELRRWASQDLRSLNGQIEFLLRDALRRRKGGEVEDPPSD